MNAYNISFKYYYPVQCNPNKLLINIHQIDQRQFIYTKCRKNIKWPNEKRKSPIQLIIYDQFFGMIDAFGK